MKIREEIQRLIKEEIHRLNELKISDPEIQANIDKLAKLDNQITRLTDQLKNLQNEAKGIENILRPMLEELQENQHRLLETNKYVVYIAKMGEANRKNVSYRDGIAWIRTKISKPLQRLLDVELEKTATFTTVISKIGISQRKYLSARKKKELGLEEGFNDVANKVWKFLKSIFIKEKKTFEGFNGELENINKTLEEYIKAFEIESTIAAN